MSNNAIRLPYDPPFEQKEHALLISIWFSFREKHNWSSIKQRANPTSWLSWWLRGRHSFISAFVPRIDPHLSFQAYAQSSLLPPLNPCLNISYETPCEVLTPAIKGSFSHLFPEKGHF
jgi:hypothetical protein